MRKEPIISDDAPKAIGPYSAGISLSDFSNLHFLSGQVPLPKEGGALVGNNAAEQTEQVMLNIEALLKAKEMNFSNVIKTTIFLKSMDDFQSVNEVYASRFPENPPARATIEVSKLPMDALVEIECIAAN